MRRDDVDLERNRRAVTMLLMEVGLSRSDLARIFGTSHDVIERRNARELDRAVHAANLLQNSIVRFNRGIV